MGRYSYETGPHIWCSYVDELFVLDVNITDYGILSFTLTNVADESAVQGSTIEELESLIANLHKSYDLKVVDGRYKDRLIIYIEDLDLVVQLFGDKITDMRIKKIIQCGNIEFRSWREFTRKDPIPVMKDWGNRFREGKCPYLTPSQYTRKRLRKVAKGKASKMFPSDIKQLTLVELAVHGGVLYNRPEEGVINNLLGYDICSAYIYSLLFKKHASTEMKQANPASWSDYLRRTDKGSIGLYRIKYNSIFTSVRCFHDTQGERLQTGEHTVEIALSNVDLRILIDNTYPGVSAVQCLMLYTFDLDYLPEEFRRYCAEEFIKKESLPRGSAAYKNQKVILNGGFFGNLLYEAKSLNEIEDAGERREALKRKRKDASTAPQWGIITMAHAKSSVYQIGLKVSGWHYSDTDSVYCDDDSYNVKLVNSFNQEVRNENIELCHELGYDKMFGEDACKLLDLGTFKLEARIKQFRAWGCKMYAYETVDGDVIQKASGCDKESLPADAETIFSPDYKPTAR